jgi:sulfate adenylyltransferase subunit 2
MSPRKGRLNCCTALKTNALKTTIDKMNLEAILLGIRRDEHGIRAKERFFSPRDKNFEWNFWNQPPELWDQYKSKPDDGTHVRVHPILSWREKDIWDYIKRENIPTNELYFAKEGKRFRSLGCTLCCNPVDSNAGTMDEVVEELTTVTTGERAGRAQDKESSYMMQKLRSLGYM